MGPERAVDLEDYLASTLSRKGLLSMAGELAEKVELNGAFLSTAYYPSWAAATVPPENLDYRRYDILFFGKFSHSINTGLPFTNSVLGYATPTSHATLNWGTDTCAVLQRVIKAAALSGSGTKIVLAIGAPRLTLRYIEDINRFPT